MASCSLAPRRSARPRLALLRLAVLKSAPPRRALVSRASWKFAFFRLAPVRSALARSRRLKLWPERSQPGQLRVLPARKSSRWSASASRPASIVANRIATRRAGDLFIMPQEWAIVRSHASGLARAPGRSLLDGGTVQQAQGKRTAGQAYAVRCLFRR